MALPRPFLFVCIVLALASPSAVLAERTLQGDLQQQMSASEFKAAGLGKLSAGELAALNNWLQGKVEQATAGAVEQAREAGRQEVIVKNRGFLDFGSNAPIESRISGKFSGFGKGRTFVLDNGQQWEQTDAAQLSGAGGQAPAVKITPGMMGVWYMQIEGFNTRAKVKRVK